MADRALVLVNLGSTASTAVADVRRYLDQFLMDRYVIDVPWPLRRFIVSRILRQRPPESAAAYRSIWWDEGSPLLVIGERLRRKLESFHEGPVRLAMRYGEPSMEQVLVQLERDGIREATLVPLYPQFADSTVTTALVEARRIVQRHRLALALDVVPPFFEEPSYIAALASSARPYLAEGFDHLLLSYHGLPERHVRRADPTGRHCLASVDCCERASGAVLERCYRAQSLRTSQRLAEALGLEPQRWTMAFQSRLGRARWIGPATDATIRALGERGIGRLLVMCPSFVADCVETLEEIVIQGGRTFRAAGGGELVLVPCLNDDDAWVAALAGLCHAAPRAPLAA